MAHSRVFQFERVNKSEFEDYNIEALTDCMLDKSNFPDPNWVNYWKDSNDSPEEDFKWFVGSLPNGMFEANEEELSLIYIQKPTDYIQKFVDTIKEEANKFSVDGFFSGLFSTWDLEKVLRNNKNDFMVYNYDDGYIVYCIDWIMGVARNCEMGDKFYLGGVLDYKF